MKVIDSQKQKLFRGDQTRNTAPAMHMQSYYNKGWRLNTAPRCTRMFTTSYCFMNTLYHCAPPPRFARVILQPFPCRPIGKLFWEEHDLIIIGAGLSGLVCADQLLSKLPSLHAPLRTTAAGRRKNQDRCSRFQK